MQRHSDSNNVLKQTHTRLTNRWEAVKTSYWFTPSLIVSSCLFIAWITLHIDRNAIIVFPESFNLFSRIEVEGSRAILSVIAGSTVSVVSLAFSITIVALTLASSQFGPRLLRNFIQKTGNQFVLGMYLGTFAYCLLVLGTVRDTSSYSFVPQFSTTIAFFLAMINIGLLVYFINNVANAMRAPVVILDIAESLQTAIDRMFPETAGEKNTDQDVFRSERPCNKTIAASDSGYVQAINKAQLLQYAQCHDLQLTLLCNAGDFIYKGKPLIKVYRLSDTAHQEEISETLLRAAIITGKLRTPEQDIGFILDQLTEMAIRALSPGINDPFTAISCIDYLGAALNTLGERSMLPTRAFDENKHLRLTMHPPQFSDFMGTSLGTISPYAVGNPRVVLHLAETFFGLFIYLEQQEQQSIARQHFFRLQAFCAKGLPSEESSRLKEIATHMDV